MLTKKQHESIKQSSPFDCSFTLMRYDPEYVLSKSTLVAKCCKTLNRFFPAKMRGVRRNSDVSKSAYREDESYDK